MSRTIAFALIAAALTTSATAAAPQRQLVAPNLNPALRTVPSVPRTYYAGHAGSSCERQLVTRVDSGTVIAGPNGRVAHITGMADSGIGAAEVMITSISANGLAATADFLICASPAWVSPAPVAASLPIGSNALETIAVRTKANAITLNTR